MLPNSMILRTFTRNLLRLNRTTQRQPVDLVVCIDIECTCDSPVQIFPMEVIELACVKLDLAKHYSYNRSKLEECSPTFHSFVKPKINPELTLFCQDLTGINQTTVDKSDTVDIVLDRLFNWLRNENLIDGNCAKLSNFAFASCGNFDMNLLSPIVKNIRFNDTDPPDYLQEWINVKKTFVTHKGEWPRGLYHMLEILGEEPSGRLHSAQDDCKNLAKIVLKLRSDGCKFYTTNRSWNVPKPSPV